MNKKPDPAVVKELERRFSILMDNYSVIKDHSGIAHGSVISFLQLLCPIGLAAGGYSFMFKDETYTKSLMTMEEFHSDLYDPVFKRLFKLAEGIVIRREKRIRKTLKETKE